MPARIPRSKTDTSLGRKLSKKFQGLDGYDMERQYLNFLLRDLACVVGLFISEQSDINRHSSMQSGKVKHSSNAIIM